MTTRETFRRIYEEIYGVEARPTLISQVTDEVMERGTVWQNRPLDPVCPIVYPEALFVKMRHEGRAENRAVFMGIGVTQGGRKEVPGLWTSATEGAKLWRQILTELCNRGVCEICAVTITGGEHARPNGISAGAGGWSVPKRDLITAVQVLLEKDELRIARRMRDVGSLVRELLDMQSTATNTGRTRLGADGFGQHDDLVECLRNN